MFCDAEVKSSLTPDLYSIPSALILSGHMDSNNNATPSAPPQAECQIDLKRFKYKNRALSEIQNQLLNCVHKQDAEGICALIPSITLNDLTEVILPEDDGTKLNLLKYAVKIGAKSLLNALYDIMILSEFRKNVHFPILYWAIATDQSSETVCKLIAAGATVHRSDITYNPLIAACRNGNLDIFSQLLVAGAQVNFVYPNLNRTILHYAAISGYFHIVLKLLEAGAKVNVVDNEGSTPLHLACQYGHEHVMVQLQASGAEVNCVTALGISPLHHACRLGRSKMVMKLLEAGAEVNCVDKNGISPLHLACEHGHEDIMNQLLAVGAKVNYSLKGNVRVRNVTTPLHYVCHLDRTQMVTKLLAAGAEVNCVDENGDTPLLVACRLKHEQTVEQLIAARANVNCFDLNRFSPLHHASRFGLAVIVNMLLNAGANANWTNCHGETALFFACCQANAADVVALLLRAGCAVDLPEPKCGTTPLQIACRKAKIDLVILLLNANASASLADKKGFTSLDYAYGGGNIQLITMLALNILDRYLAQLLEKKEEKYATVRDKFFGGFSAQTDRTSCYQAAYHLREYILGKIDYGQLKQYKSTYKLVPELKVVNDFYTKYPELIEKPSNNHISLMLKRYFDAKKENNMQESNLVKEKIFMLSMKNKNDIEPYIVLAMVYFDELNANDIDMSKIHSALLCVQALDPGFVQSKKLITTWVDADFIQNSTVEMLWRECEVVRQKAYSEGLSEGWSLINN